MLPDSVILSSPNVGRSTVTVNVQVLVLPQPSVAKQMTVFVELGRNAVPDSGMEPTVTGPQAFVASTIQVAITFVSHVVRTTLSGQWIIGGIPRMATV